MMLKIDTFIKEESGIDYFIKFDIDISKEEFIKSINDRFNTDFPLSTKILKLPCGEDMFSIKLNVLTMEDMGVVYD